MSLMKYVDDYLRTFFYGYPMVDEQARKDIKQVRKLVQKLDARITEIEQSDDPWREMARSIRGDDRSDGDGAGVH